jgi:hypothetical protein
LKEEPAMANRHERRRLKRQFTVSIETIRIDHILRQGELASTFLAMAGAMNSPRPPRCGACELLLTPDNPPAEWLLFRRLDTGARFLAGICPKCAGTNDLIRQAAAYAGVRPIGVMHPWGNA